MASHRLIGMGLILGENVLSVDKKFNRKVNIYNLQKILAHHVLRA